MVRRVSHAPIPDGVDPRSAELLRRAYSLDNVSDGQELYREWAETYDTTMLDGLGYVSPRLVVGLAAEMRDRIVGPVLDIGCGTGLLGSELRAEGFTDVDGIDLSPAMLEVAARRGAYRTLLEADLTAVLPMADAAYGGAVCAGTFTSGHVDASCLDEIVRVLAPGAVLVCTVHHAVWHELGFDVGFERLSRSGALTELTRREVGFYDNTSADGFLLALRRH
jgi:SAM-dependent methyltransferase